MQAPTINAGSGAGQVTTTGTGGAGASGTCGDCGQSGGSSRQPGLNSSATVSGDPASAAASMFSPGELDRDDALLLWTGLNTVLMAVIVYYEVVK